MTTVMAMLARSAQSPSPLDAVMGEDWLEVELGRSTAVSLLRRVDRDAMREARGGSRHGGGGGGGLGAFAPLLRRPEAMVKMVRSGGTATLRGARDQMSYLRKEGEVVLRRSERYFGLPIERNDEGRILRAWGVGAGGAGTADRTTHFVVSFPAGTDAEAAERAGRAWAEAMFGTGLYGDVWDYYTAHHTDRAHPHTHVVVARRGMERGEWLKVSRRSAIDYDELRLVQIEVAEREGIALQATTRLARGVHERPLPDAQVRAEREGRGVQGAPDHTTASAARAALSLLRTAGRMRAAAGIIEIVHPSVGTALRTLADDLERGKGLRAAELDVPPSAIEECANMVNEKRELLRGDIARIDRELATVPDPGLRAPLEREASRLKGQAAALLPDEPDLRRHAAMGERYRGLDPAERPSDGIEARLRQRVERDVRRVATEAGLDGEATIARYGFAAGVAEPLATAWRRDEIERLSLVREGVGDGARASAEAERVHADVHRRIASLFTAARNELTEHEQRKARLRETFEGREAGPSTSHRSPNGADVRDGVRAVLTPEERARLETGRPDALAGVAEDRGVRERLARRYFERAVADASGAERARLRRALDGLPETSTDRPARDRTRSHGHEL